MNYPRYAEHISQISKLLRRIADPTATFRRIKTVHSVPKDWPQLFQAIDTAIEIGGNGVTIYSTQ